jgi:anti-sigma factor RsiW
MNETQVSEADLHGFVDGQLDPAARRQVEAYLAARPDQAALVAGWQRDAERLRASMANPELLLPANTALDPLRLRQGLRRRRRRRAALAAMLVLGICLGAGGGWQLRATLPGGGVQPMADAIQAHRLFAGTEIGPPPGLPPAAIQPWLAAQFGTGGGLPDLEELGLRPVEGQALVTNDGAAALVLYADARGNQVSFYIRPRPGRTIEGARTEDGLLAQYWTHGAYSFAVVTRADDPRAARLSQLLARRT